MSTYKDIGVEKVGHVGTIEIRRPPLNFFDISLINQIADALDEFDRDIEIRASVLSAHASCTLPRAMSRLLLRRPLSAVR